MDENKIKKVEKILLLITGISLPLIELRAEFSGFSISMFMLLLIILIIYNSKIILNNYTYSHSDILIFIFSLSMLFSSIYAVDVFYALSQWLKLVITILIYAGLKTLFYKKPYYFWMIIKTACVALAIYLMYLMYYYLYRFGVTYIGVETDYSTRTGKNSLAFMIALVLPFSLYFMVNEPIIKKKKILNLLISVITIIGSILIQSRALILFFILYTCVILIHKRISIRNFKSVLIYSIVLLVIVNIFAPEKIINDVQTRISSFVYFFEDDYVASGNSATSGIASLEKRSYLIEKGLNMVGEKPIIGHGIGSFRYYGGASSAVSHNDYIRILAEQGIIGLAIFLVLIGYFMLNAFKTYKMDKKNLAVLLAIIGIFAYLFMINAYDNILLWFLMAMVTANKRRYHKKNKQSIMIKKKIGGQDENIN